MKEMIRLGDAAYWRCDQVAAVEIDGCDVKVTPVMGEKEVSRTIHVYRCASEMIANDVFVKFSNSLRDALGSPFLH